MIRQRETSGPRLILRSLHCRLAVERIDYSTTTLLLRLGYTQHVQSRVPVLLRADPIWVDPPRSQLQLAIKKALSPFLSPSQLTCSLRPQLLPPALICRATPSPARAGSPHTFVVPSSHKTQRSQRSSCAPVDAHKRGYLASSSSLARSYAAECSSFVPAAGGEVQQRRAEDVEPKVVVAWQHLRGRDQRAHLQAPGPAPQLPPPRLRPGVDDEAAQGDVQLHQEPPPGGGRPERPAVGPHVHHGPQQPRRGDHPQHPPLLITWRLLLRRRRRSSS